MRTHPGEHRNPRSRPRSARAGRYLAAAGEIGCAIEAGAYFRSLRYRWYHLLPDRVVANPLVFFFPSFLLTGFFSRRLRGYEGED